MSFTNTVETIGDAALSNSIIDRSITELNDNISTSIGQYAFRDCKALTNVNFPSVTSAAMAAFWECTALAKAEFSACVAFANNTFYGCSALTALILRCADQVCTLTGNLSGTPIASGTGYIYVPAALVDTYKAASGWSTYAAQIRAIEDWPGISDPYSWAGVFANIDNGTYATVYKIGDLVPLDLGTEGVVNMQIVGIDVDALADGSGAAPISWISKELLKTRHRMNPALVTNDDGTYQEGTGAIGGWEKSEMRTYLNDTIKPMIPSDVQSMIKTVTKSQKYYDTSGKIGTQTTEDKVWLVANEESSKYSSWYNVSSNRKKFLVGKTSASEWWQRDPQKSEAFFRVSDSGAWTLYQYKDAYHNLGIALGFCT